MEKSKNDFRTPGVSTPSTFAIFMAMLTCSVLGIFLGGLVFHKLDQMKYICPNDPEGYITTLGNGRRIDESRVFGNTPYSWGRNFYAYQDYSRSKLPTKDSQWFVSSYFSDEDMRSIGTWTYDVPAGFTLEQLVYVKPNGADESEWTFYGSRLYIGPTEAEIVIAPIYDRPDTEDKDTILRITCN